MPAESDGRKHGGDQKRLPLDAVASAASTTAQRPARPRRRPDRLPRQEPLKAELVKLRYFAGLSVEETAACLGIAPATANGTGPLPVPGSMPPCPRGGDRARTTEFFRHDDPNSSLKLAL